MAGYYLKVKDLKTLLNKYSDDAIIMVGINREDGEAYEADSELTYCYRTLDGEMIDEFNVEDGESLVNYKRALVLWAIDR